MRHIVIAAALLFLSVAPTYPTEPLRAEDFPVNVFPPPPPADLGLNQAAWQRLYALPADARKQRLDYVR
jgi:hypothetical protein